MSYESLKEKVVKKGGEIKLTKKEVSVFIEAIGSLEGDALKEELWFAIDNKLSGHKLIKEYLLENQREILETMQKENLKLVYNRNGA